MTLRFVIESVFIFNGTTHIYIVSYYQGGSFYLNLLATQMSNANIKSILKVIIFPDIFYIKRDVQVKRRMSI